MLPRKRTRRLASAAATAAMTLSFANAQQTTTVVGNEACTSPDSYDLESDQTNRSGARRVWHGCGLRIINVFTRGPGYGPLVLSNVHITRCSCHGPVRPSGGQSGTSQGGGE